MPIENRNLKPGTRLLVRYHKQPYRCEVMEGENGKIRYRLQDGREFKSPSAAGMAITGKACNGWAFWSTATETTPAPEVAASEDAAAGQAVAAPTEPAPAAKETIQTQIHIYKLPNQRGAPEGQVRWYCSGCGKSFPAPTGETPAVCPQGHRDN
jgi:hypothetical protein